MEGLPVGFLVWESPMIRAEWYTMKLVILPLERGLKVSCEGPNRQLQGRVPDGT